MLWAMAKFVFILVLSMFRVRVCSRISSVLLITFCVFAIWVCWMVVTRWVI